MSRRPRKTNRSNCEPATMEEARKRILDGESKRQVAASLGMAESTLRLRLQKDECPSKLGRFDTTFSAEVEKDFCDHLQLLDEMFYGIAAKDLRRAAFEFAVKNKIPHRFNVETKIAGKEWFRGFMKRHPEIALRQPTSTSLARAMGFNRPQVTRFYIKMSAVMDKYNFPPQSIYNMDETGISTVPNRPPRVLSIKGKRAVSKISSAERGTNVTMVNAVSATGHFIPPAFIFGRKRMKPELIDGAPAGSIGMISDSSFINGDLFIDWLSHFKDHARPSAGHPVLLILDNHTSHCSLKAVEFYRTNNIVALTLPPHSSHKMQPLDRGFHGALKKYYAAECEKWLRSHPGRAITTFQVASIVSLAFYKAGTAICGVESFRCTGIWPWNPDVFTDADFLASSVTERVNPRDESEQNYFSTQDAHSEEEIVSCSSQAPAVSSMEVVEVFSIEAITRCPQQTLKVSSIEAEAGCSSSPEVPSVQAVASCSSSRTTSAPPNLAVARCSDPKEAPSSPLSNTVAIKNIAISPSIRDIIPAPKSEFKRATNRKHKKAEVISSSPYKTQLEEEEKSRKKPKQLPNTKTTKKNFKKPKPNKKKKIWSCGGCTETFKEPINEDWIECHACGTWWHEKCTDYLGFGRFQCDLCK